MANKPFDRTKEHGLVAYRSCQGLTNTFVLGWVTDWGACSMSLNDRDLLWLEPCFADDILEETRERWAVWHEDWSAILVLVNSGARYTSENLITVRNCI